MGHPNVICQTIMNMPVQPSCTRKACKPWSFHQHHPISSHLVSCQPKHPSMLFFIFQLICSTPPSNVLERPDPKTEPIYSLWLVLPAHAQKLLAKTNPNQNAVVHSIMNPHLPKVLSSWYIKVVLLPRRRSEQKCDFRRTFIYKSLKKGKRGY